MTKSESEQAARALRVMATVLRIRPLLEGRGPDVQMAVIASLTATWLHGFKGTDRQARDEARAELREVFLQMVAEMLKIEDGEEEKS